MLRIGIPATLADQESSDIVHKLGVGQCNPAGKSADVGAFYAPATVDLALI